MPEPIFLLFELISYLYFGFCLRHALARGCALELLAGVSYGLLLEVATIVQFQGYHYGRFLVMFGEVPLCIAVSWGVILYRPMVSCLAGPSGAAPVLCVCGPFSFPVPDHPIDVDALYVKYAFLIYDGPWLVMVGQLLLSLVAIWASRRFLRPPQTVDWPIVSVPLVFHLFYTGALL